MANFNVPNTNTSTRADTVATANTIVLRDNSAGVTHGIVTAASFVSTGTVNFGLTTVTSGTTTVGSYSTYLCNATGGAITANLPNASGNSGLRFEFKKTDSSGNTVTITNPGGATIDGASTKVISTQYNTVRVVCDGTNYWVF